MALTVDGYEIHKTGTPDDLLSARAPLHVQLIAIIVVLGGLCFNLFLCFVNTRFMTINESHVMMMEMLIIGMAFLGAADRRAGLYIFISVFVSYMLFLFALRGINDLKAVRDILIPVVFFALGSRLGDLKLADKLALISALIALFFALFEYFMLDTYLNYFNIIGYYLAKGSVTLDETFGQIRGLFISGIRPEPRTILPFLGQHRVASVLLEPVSMGNFGVILFAWALFRREYMGRYVIMPIALLLVAFADARFGLLTCIIMAVLAPVLKIVPRTIWLVIPFILLASIAAYGLMTSTEGGPNDILGRIQVTAHILTGLNAGIVFGYEATDLFTADSGLAYTLTKFGILGFIGVWAVFVFLPVKSSRAWQFHSMIIIYLLLLMIISNSFYSIKTAALMWFLLGTTSAAQLPELKSRWSQFLGYLDQRSAAVK